MRIISKRRLREFWESLEGKNSERPLSAWYGVVKNAAWQNLNDVKATFGHAADIVGDCIVFDVGNNRWRLIARLRAKRKRVYVLKIMTHTVYDKRAWIDECGCYKKPPR